MPDFHRRGLSHPNAEGNPDRATVVGRKRKEVPYESNQNEAYWHSQLESNQHQQSQSLLCYRYTMTVYK